MMYCYSRITIFELTSRVESATKINAIQGSCFMQTNAELLSLVGRVHSSIEKYREYGMTIVNKHLLEFLV